MTTLSPSPSPASRRGEKKIAITIGDVAGIGPETIAMLWRDHADAVKSCVVYGDRAAMQRACDLVGADAAQISMVQVSEPLSASKLPAYGLVSAVAGRLAADAVRSATHAALRGEVTAIVTAPLHKEALHAAGVDYPGHTEMLQALCAAHHTKTMADMPVRMMLANEELAVVLVSIHVPMREALNGLRTEGILETIRITHAHYVDQRGFKPRIAVAGINPHAGEGGLFGREEIETIAPAVQAATKLGMDVSGPYAPDTVFMRARRFEAFDVVIAMYHDQGLIPVKYLGVEQGVNITLGLPIVRTSPDHGTAFDISGQKKADPSSLLCALKRARALIA